MLSRCISLCAVFTPHDVFALKLQRTHPSNHQDAPTVGEQTVPDVSSKLLESSKKLEKDHEKDEKVLFDGSKIISQMLKMLFSTAVDVHLAETTTRWGLFAGDILVTSRRVPSSS